MNQKSIELFLNSIVVSDCLEGLKMLQDSSVNCCVTSPPYFGLRNYGCDGQIGMEQTPEEFIAKLVGVFREVRRVLMENGTLWVNIGDTYHGGNTQPCGGGHNGKHIRSGVPPRKKAIEGLKRKDLIGIPWMLAFALRADGWYLRQDIIWHKPNPMPESVKDRCVYSHEYIFLLSKSDKYFFDYQSIQEKATTYHSSGNGFQRTYRETFKNYDGESRGNLKPWEPKDMRNKRSVWSVNVKPFRESHFATFPEDLIVDCIKAGCPDGGIVLDPFMGAGTTALVAQKLDRNFVGFELNPKYVEIANVRLRDKLGMFYKDSAV